MSAVLFHLIIISVSLPDVNTIFFWLVIVGNSAVVLTKNLVYCFHFPFLCYKVIISKRIHTTVNNESIAFFNFFRTIRRILSVLGDLLY